MVRRIVRIVLTITVVLAILGGNVLAVTGTVTGTTVRIRESASANSQEISAAKKGEKVEVIGEEGDWYQVEFENVTGYISKDYVDADYTAESSESVTTEVETPTEEPEQPVEEQSAEPEQTQEESSTAEETTNVEMPEYVENQVITLEQDVNLRYIPNFTSRVKASATAGTTYNVQASLNNWMKISNESNTGWVLKSLVTGEIENVPVEQEPTEENPPEENSETPEATNTLQGKVNVDSARIRKSANGEILDSLSKGTVVTILDEEDDWYKIETEQYGECYIAKRLITEL